jgi:hypothetical protein
MLRLVQKSKPGSANKIVPSGGPSSRTKASTTSAHGKASSHASSAAVSSRVAGAFVRAPARTAVLPRLRAGVAAIGQPVARLTSPAGSDSLAGCGAGSGSPGGALWNDPRIS